ncbi:hypothetical protein H6G33_09990 [Calothrix sp. FACHB-1219]|uniref:hypothetical protein n=1 Tax=unclassified Calothrix TaxID=2619626 RepID=UPI00168709ED|nr:MULTISPECIES: hypothetical protein [unclassified Calothrix]MBD2201677.1 hypothetical protein [Calothrix sp. FACHB-168]MBD2217363.1 hypothetical protein [Calothrix sp. FACHB-1219]
MTYSNWNPNVSTRDIVNSLQKTIEDLEINGPIPIAVGIEEDKFNELTSYFQKVNGNYPSYYGVRAYPMRGLDIPFKSYYNEEDLKLDLSIYGVDNEK